MKKKFILLTLLIAVAVAVFIGVSLTASADEDKKIELNENIIKLLEDLDLSELQKYLDENEDSYLFQYGDTAGEIIKYLIQGNLNTDYGGYLNELLSILFKNVISLIPAFATVVAVALLSAIVSSAEGNILGKSTSKIVHLACYSLIILIITSMLLGVISDCLSSINSVRKQIEIITPILTTLTVLTGGTSSAAIYQPSAIFLSSERWK